MNTFLVTRLDMVVHLSLIKEILTTKQTTVLNLRRHVARIHVRMRKENVIGHVARVLTDEHVGTGSAFHSPKVRGHRKNVERKKVVVVVQHAFDVKICMF